MYKSIYGLFCEVYCSWLCEASDERSEHARCGLYSWTTGENVLHLISMQIVGPTTFISLFGFVLFCFESLVYQWTLLFMFLSYVSFFVNKCWIVGRIFQVMVRVSFILRLTVHALLKLMFVSRSSPVCFKHPSQILFRRDSYTDMHLNIMYCTHLLYCNVFVC